MREFDQIWSSNGSSGAQTAVEVHGCPTHTAFYFQGSTGVATATVTVESGPTSGGPFANEGGSTSLTSGAMVVVRITGPLAWVRPNLNSTGITVRAIGVR